MLLWFDHDKCGICSNSPLSPCEECIKLVSTDRHGSSDPKPPDAPNIVTINCMASHLHDNIIMVRTGHVRVDRARRETD